MRSPAETDFFVLVPDIGTFRFARRTYGDRLKIRAEYLRLVREFDDVDADLSTQAAMIAAHKVLCVEAPAGWEDLEAVDLVEVPDAEERIFTIYDALKAKEDSFRLPAGEGGEAARP